MTFANSGPKNLALSGEEKATTEPNGGPMLRPSPCSGPIQADYDYDYRGGASRSSLEIEHVSDTGYCIDSNI